MRPFSLAEITSGSSFKPEETNILGCLEVENDLCAWESVNLSGIHVSQNVHSA